MVPTEGPSARNNGRPASEPKRLFICVAVGTYDFADDEGFRNLSDVRSEVRSMRRLMRRLGYEMRFPELTNNPSLQDFLKLTKWFVERTRTPGCSNETIVFYFTGHGLQTANGTHYLMMRDSDPEDPDATAVSAGLLFRTLFANARKSGAPSPFSQLLIILDTCHSGAGQFELMEDALGLEGKNAFRDKAYCIATSRPDQSSRVNAFALALNRVLMTRSGSLADSRGSWDSPKAVADSVQPHLSPQKIVPRALSESPESSDWQFFPNLSHGSRPPALPAHFVGREKSMDLLRSWLVAGPEAGSRVRVITGKPGAGKSTLLGQMWNERFEAPEGAPAATGNTRSPIWISAYQKGGGDLVQALARALHESHGDAIDPACKDSSELLTAIEERALPAIDLYVDAFDEASDRLGCATFLAAFLDISAHSRLIIASRKNALDLAAAVRKFSAGTEDLVDIDVAGDLAIEDIEGYVTARFAETMAPELERVSGAIARRAQTNMLVATLLCDYLEESLLFGADEVKQAVQRLVEEDVVADLSSAFELMLERFGPDSRSFGKARAMRFLLPLAYAKGEGLPEDVWILLANALSPGEKEKFGEKTVTDAVNYAGAYVASSRPGGDRKATFRLFHAEFGAFLRAHVSRAGDEGQDNDQWAHREIVESLKGTVPGNAEGAARYWELPSSGYVRQQLAFHALDAGESLGDPWFDPAFLCFVVKPRWLDQRKFSDPRARLAWSCFREALIDPRVDYQPWKVMLRLEGTEKKVRNAAFQNRYENEALERFATDCCVRARALRPHRLAQLVEAVAEGSASCRVASLLNGTARVHRLNNAGVESEEQPLPASEAICLVGLTINGTGALLSGGCGGRVQSLIGSLPSFNPPRSSILAMAAGGDSAAPFLVTGHLDGSIAIFDLLNGNPVCCIQSELGVIQSLAIVDCDGRHLISAMFRPHRDGAGSIATWHLDGERYCGGGLFNVENIGNQAVLSVFDSNTTMLACTEMRDASTVRVFSAPVGWLPASLDRSSRYQSLDSGSRISLIDPATQQPWNDVSNVSFKINQITAGESVCRMALDLGQSRSRLVIGTSAGRLLIYALEFDAENLGFRLESETCFSHPVDDILIRSDCVIVATTKQVELVWPSDLAASAQPD